MSFLWDQGSMSNKKKTKRLNQKDDVDGFTCILYLHHRPPCRWVYDFLLQLFASHVSNETSQHLFFLQIIDRIAHATSRRSNKQPLNSTRSDKRHALISVLPNIRNVDLSNSAVLAAPSNSDFQMPWDFSGAPCGIRTLAIRFNAVDVIQGAEGKFLLQQ